MKTAVASDLKTTRKLTAEIQSFQDLWQGGYYEGDPLDPRSGSNYPLEFSFMSVLHVTYLACIKPYVNSNTRALEIGPGRGAWTKAMLKSGASEIYCLDALSAEHNGFWEYLQNPKNVKYFQVSDFECRDVPDDTFDYLFSFGCLCHVSPEGVEAYFRNLYPKLRKGAQGFVMIADYEKYNRAVEQGKSGGIAQNMFRAKRLLPIRLQMRFLESIFYPKLKTLEESGEAAPGRWYNLGVKEACRMLQQYGYEIVDPDMDVNYRDPVIHFRKPA